MIVLPHCIFLLIRRSQLLDRGYTVSDGLFRSGGLHLSDRFVAGSELLFRHWLQGQGTVW